jgi:hypothetical protein
MEFNRHKDLEGKHATLSASSWRWLNDDQESLTKRLCSQYATEIGTILHDIACKHIRYQVKLNKYDQKNVMLELLSRGIPSFVVDYFDLDTKFENLMAYVNDCIGYRMTPEVVLFYSYNCFGTADAIGYSERNRFLRIHDYKSGTTTAYMEQPLIYAGLFCLEYRIKPTDIETELRIYQNNEVMVHNPSSEELVTVIDNIVSSENLVTKLKEGV